MERVTLCAGFSSFLEEAPVAPILKVPPGSDTISIVRMPVKSAFAPDVLSIMTVRDTGVNV